MDFNVFMENIVPIVVLGCLVLGYILKHSFSFIKNDFIPVILGVVGAIINVLVSGLSVETIIYGAFMGLLATGLHQAFTRFIEGVGGSSNAE